MNTVDVWYCPVCREQLAGLVDRWCQHCGAVPAAPPDIVAEVEVPAPPDMFIAHRFGEDVQWIKRFMVKVTREAR